MEYKIYKACLLSLIMVEFINIIIGVVVLILGIPIGSFLASKTKEELKSGQVWFKTIIVLSLIGAVAAVFLRSDVFFFSSLFIAIVTSRSLKK